MKSEQVIQRLSTTPEASIENLQEHRYWLQCERAYTWQPIYRTDGRLMAIEILTVVTHPSNPTQRIAPDRYFAEVAVRQRLDVLEEQLRMLATKQAFFEHCRNNLVLFLVSVFFAVVFVVFVFFFSSSTEVVPSAAFSTVDFFIFSSFVSAAFVACFFSVAIRYLPFLPILFPIIYEICSFTAPCSIFFCCTSFCSSLRSVTSPACRSKLCSLIFRIRSVIAFFFSSA